MDQEFIRDLLLMIEAGQSIFEPIEPAMRSNLGLPPDPKMTTALAHKLRYHLDQLAAAGLIEIEFISTANVYTIKNITSDGREYLKRIR